MPGLRTSADQLVRSAAKLTATDLVPPAHAIGRTTEDNVRGGILFGAADAVDGMIRRIFAEWPGGPPPRVIATGGLATLVALLPSPSTWSIPTSRYMACGSPQSSSSCSDEGRSEPERRPGGITAVILSICGRQNGR